ncbi:hypothetical protein BB559_006922 [Furculomyces boomerangus]|uniref:Disintegrin domain-containing protein n=1 Tax=Furculomyces boomerangus TaxID=61424 RepID=A0A2T9XZU6_9FUNG|nr:hypothetical protein BB559_006922 [Furculomyces boomerangus]
MKIAIVHGIGKSSVIAGYEFLAEPKIHVFSQPVDLASQSKQNLGKRNLLEKRSINDITKSDSFQMDLTTYNQTYRLILEPNHDLIHSDAIITIHKPDGTKQVKKLTEVDNSGYYRGRVQLIGNNGFSSAFDTWEKALRKRSSHVFDEFESWARIAIHNEPGGSVLDGTYSIGEETFFIKPIKVYENTKRSSDPSITTLNRRSIDAQKSKSIIYRTNDFIENQKTGLNANVANNIDGICKSRHYTNATYGVNQDDPHFAFGGVIEKSLLSKRQTTQGSTFNDQAAISAGCLATKKILYMGAATDCTYTTLYGGTDGARKQILSNWNQISAVYERQFNVALGLVQVDISDISCTGSTDSSRSWNRECATSYPIDKRLSDFSSWRGAKGKDGTGLWHLLTNCASGTEVGLAWVGTLCKTDAQRSGDAQGSVVSGTGVSSSTRDEWKVIAHEIGHNFGAIHDCVNSNCPCSPPSCNACCPCTDKCDCSGQFIMNPSSPVATDNFSPCSIKSICSVIGSQGVSCLSDPGTKPTLGTAMCGNGILEQGEECDCGTPEECKDNKCCDGSTCKLLPGAKCLDSNSMCCKDCQIMKKDTVCRSKYSECDVEEVCDGSSPNCPPDSHVKDGTNCGNSSGLKCASGVCTSRDAQCAARSGSVDYSTYCKLSTFGNLCDIQCQSSSSSVVCMIMSGSYIEGTYCGWNAYCRNGSCKGINFFYTALLIFQRSLLIAIPVAIVILLILFYIIFSLLRMCFGRKPKRNVQNTTPFLYSNHNNQQYNNPSAYTNYPPNYPAGYTPSPQANNTNTTGWVDPYLYNGVGAPGPNRTNNYNYNRN